jgi:hypothetical protein
MQRLTIITLLAVSLLSISVDAQDPGAPDSIIIQTDTIYSYPTPPIFYIQVYFVTDDSIAFFNLPLSLHCLNSNAIFGSSIWRGDLIYWDDCYDTIVDPHNLLRIVGWNDLGGENNPPIFTNNLRVLELELRIYLIDAFGFSYFITLIEGDDPLNGGILLGTTEYEDIRPVFIPGGIVYLFGVNEPNEIPTKFSLNPNYPNPFNSSTTISYGIPSESEVTLEIYDILGKRVASLVNQKQPVGNYQVNWNAGGMPSGAYFARLKAGQQSQTMKMILIK